MTTKAFTRLTACAALSIGLLAAAGPSAAHHSFAMFDYANRLTLTGTVASFEWTNPHAFIKLTIPDGQGGTKHYTVECASPNVLTRMGWKFSTLKTGDKVTLLINPLKSGEFGGMLQEATLADGRVLTDGNPPAGKFNN